MIVDKLVGDSIMPIYEYTCEKCGHQLEAIQKFSDPLLIDCPECKEPALKKQISASAFQLKGTGWYATDFRDKGKNKDTEKKSSDTKPADSVASPDKNEKSDKDKKESKPDTASATTSQSTKSSSSGEQ
jgi:putative FmdB family regulatory protein